MKSGRFAAANRKRQEIQQLRRIDALKLRLEGLSIDVIAERLAVDEATAYRDIRAQLDAMTIQGTAEAERLRTLAHLRLEALVAALWPNCDDPRVAREIMRAVEIEARLYGLVSAAEAAERPLIRVEELQVLLLERKRAAIESARAAGIDLTLPAPAARSNGSAVSQ